MIQTNRILVDTRLQSFILWKTDLILRSAAPDRYLLKATNQINLQLKQNPYHLLLLAGLVVLLTSLLLNSDKAVDIHVDDTYYVIGQSHIFWLFAFSVWLLWFLYLLTRKVLFSKLLTWIHVIITLVTLLSLLCLLNFSNNNLNALPRRYFDFSRPNLFDKYNEYMRWVAYSIIALLSGQIIFIVNFFAGIIKRLKR